MIDDALAFQLDLFRLDAATRARVLPILDLLQRELVGQLATSDNLTDWNKRRIRALLADARDVIARYYADAQGELFQTLDGLAPIASSAAQAALAASVPVGLAVGLAPESYLASLASDAIIQGATQAAWWARQSADTAWRFETAVRTGLAAGETNQQIIARIAGKSGFPGVMEIARNNAAALVQTSVQTVANNARQATFEANSDLIARYRWITALDSHVCWSAETPILMADGSQKQAGDVAVGDLVVGGVTGKLCRVAFAGKRIVPSSVVIHYNDAVIGRVTHDHPILTPNGWQEIAAVGLSADVRQREVLCRRCPPSGSAIPATSQERRDGQAVRDQQCVAEAWGSDPVDSRNDAFIRMGVRAGTGAHSDAEYDGAERLQHDERRGGCCQSSAGNVESERRTTGATIQGRCRISGEDARGGEAGGAEGCDNAQGVQRDAGGASDHCTAHGSGVESEDMCRTQGSDDASRARKNAHSHEGAMGRPCVSGQGQCGARCEAGGATCERSGMGCEEGREDGRVDAQEVGERPGISGEGVGTRGADCVAGGAYQGRSEAAGRHDAGGARRDCGEDAPAVGEAENVFVGVIRAELGGACEVITLSIEDDPTYVAGGLIVHNCNICAARADKAWSVDHAPQGHSIAWATPPVHFNDRCVIVPETKTWRELGIDMPEPPPGMRASRDGPVPASTTFAQFLERKGAAFQDEVLGPGRAQLWRDGSISLADLVNGRGNPISLADLLAKYA